MSTFFMMYIKIKYDLSKWAADWRARLKFDLEQCQLFVYPSFVYNLLSTNRRNSPMAVASRVSLKSQNGLAFHQRCTLAARSQSMFYILLYYACGK